MQLLAAMKNDPQFGAFRSDDLCNSAPKSQVADKKPNRSVDTKSEKVVISQPMMKLKINPTLKDAKITFVASPTEQQIIAAGLEKYGIRKMSEILRMALKCFAKAEGIKVGN